MKKLSILFLAIVASVGTIWAYYDAQIGDLYYNLNSSNKTAEVTYKSYSDYKYNEGWSITTATIPSSVTYRGTTYSVTSIGNYAFSGCTNLTSVNIGNGVTSIGDYAFYGCSSLTSITIPNSVTSIEWRAFENCSSLTSVNIPNSVTSIGGRAFYNCSALTSVTIGNSVTSIGECAFSGCTGLTAVTIPNSVTSIEREAFYGCTGLTSITIPSVTSIGDYAFSDCTGLTSVTIGNGVTSIGNHAFSGCTNLTSVNIGNGVTSIGYQAFYGCTGLTSVTIPNSVTYIGEDAFYGCTALTSVTLNSNAITSESYEYDKNISNIFGTQVKEYVIGNSVTSIGRYAFQNCSSLTSVTIGNSVTRIENLAFGFCSALTSIICYAVTPPEGLDFSFYEVNLSIPLYVPAGSVEAYKNAYEWKDFTNILPIESATEIESAEVKATPSNSNSVSITWPEVSNATTYTIEIKKNGVLICTLTFNAEGILINKTFAAPARDGARNVASALQAGNGWTYTVTGLESNTDYTYTVIAKNAGGGVLLDQTVGFKTPLPDAIEDVVSDSGAAVKTLYNGQVLIQRAGKTYTLQGQEVR